MSVDVKTVQQVPVSIDEEAYLESKKALQILVKHVPLSTARPRIIGFGEPSVDGYARIRIPRGRKLVLKYGTVWKNVLRSTVAHEYLHVAVSPVVHWVNTIMKAAEEAAGRLNIDFDPSLAAKVFNAVSDAIVEIFAGRKLPEPLATDTRIKAEARTRWIKPPKILASQVLALATVRLAGRNDPEWASEEAKRVVNSIEKYVEKIGEVPANTALYEITSNGLRKIVHKGTNYYFFIMGSEEPELEGFIGQAAILVGTYLYLAEQRVDTKLVEVEIDADVEPPRAPPVIDLDSLFRENTVGVLGPNAIEALAKRLVAPAIMGVGGKETAAYTVVARWRGFGRPLPSRIFMPPYEWLVKRKVYESMIGGPKTITLVIDVSGSTGVATEALAPVAGGPVTVFDAERAVLLAMLFATERLGYRPKVNLVSFSSNVHVESGLEFHKAVETLKTLHKKAEFMETNIEKGVEEGVRVHEAAGGRGRDPIIIATDAEITSAQAEYVYSILARQGSPTLLVVVSNPLPKNLEALNYLPHAAAVSVRSVDDIPELEKAMKKIVAAIAGAIEEY